MPPSRTVHLALWVAYAVTAMLHLGALIAGLEPLRAATQPLFAPLLLGALLTAVPTFTASTRLVALGLVLAWVGDTLGQLVPGGIQLVVVVPFLGALLCYAAALAPVWRRHRDGLRLALAVPYAGVVVGLFLACADGAGSLLPLVAAYAIALGTMAFLSAGGNALTWMGGTLFLVSSSVLAMEWFLPGAAISYSPLWVMLTYVIGQALLVGGTIALMPSHRWTGARPGAALVIVES